MATAAPSFSEALRQQIEHALAAKSGARLELAPRLIRDGIGTGFAALDAILPGGLPVAGTTEIVGSRSSGRATIASACLAQRTREGLVCAWIDVAGGLTPDAAAANGVDLARLLWIRCGAIPREHSSDFQPAPHPQLKLVSYARDKSIGTPGVPNRPLNEERKVQVSEDRLPKRRGSAAVHSRPAILPTRYEQERKPAKPSSFRIVQGSGQAAIHPKNPWKRLEQGIKAVDLLVQAGGFGTIVFDMGGIGPEFARKIPLATWFRWRAALERTRTSLLVLSPATASGSQLGCAGSSAELVLRVAAEIPGEATVMSSVPYRLEVVRRRFEEAAEFTRRKAVAKAPAWQSRATWNDIGSAS